MIQPVYIGTAGWSIPAAYAGHFPAMGSHLERYARRFPAVEINSSFYRPHKPETYARWARSVPPEFRFSVKMPRAITHARRLKNPEEQLHLFLDGCTRLDEKLGALLIQLPPSLRFDAGQVEAFFTLLRGAYAGDVVCEPRHPTWFAPDPDALLARFRVARVAADPAVVPAAAAPGASEQVVYFRLHGSPRIYHSPYPEEFLTTLTARLAAHAAAGARVWCIFDNTAEFYATRDALTLLRSE